MDESEYRKQKKEIGLSVDNLENRLHAINRSELTEDILINLVMANHTERKDQLGIKSTGIAKKLEFFYDAEDEEEIDIDLKEIDDSIKSIKKASLEANSNQETPRNEDQLSSKRSRSGNFDKLNSKRSVNSSKASSRIFERLRSSHGTGADIETARFPRPPEPLSSHRERIMENSQSNESFSNKRITHPKQLSQIPETELPELSISDIRNATNATREGNPPLLNTFSTIKPIDTFDNPNNSSSKYQHQLMRELRITTIRADNYKTKDMLNDSFEFTGIRSSLVNSLECIDNPIDRFKRSSSIKSKRFSDYDQNELQTSRDLPNELTSSNLTEKFDGFVDTHIKESIASKMKESLESDYQEANMRAHYIPKSLTTNKQSSNVMGSHDYSNKDLTSKKTTKITIPINDITSTSKIKPSRIQEFVDNITNKLELLSKAITRFGREHIQPEEKKLLDAIHSMHVFGFSNACVLCLDLSQMKRLINIESFTALSTIYFRQIIEKIGVLKISNCELSPHALQTVTHPGITIINLSNCNIVSLKPYLITLTNLKLLNAANNKLKNINGVQKCPLLKELYLANNEIEDISHLEGCQFIQVAMFEYNSISDFRQVKFLSRLKAISNIGVKGNPIACSKLFRSKVASKFSPIVKIDCFDINVNEIGVILVQYRIQRPENSMGRRCIC